MNLLDIFDHEFGLFEQIIEELNDTDLNNVLLCKKWDNQKRAKMLYRLISHIRSDFKSNRINIILPCLPGKTDTNVTISNIINNYTGNVIIRRTKGWSLGKVTSQHNENWSLLYKPTRTFIRVDEPQYSKLVSYINIYSQSLGDINTECILGVLTFAPPGHVLEGAPYWDYKKYILIPPNIHKVMCERMSRIPIEV